MQETIDGAVQDPLFRRYLRLFMDSEVTPILEPVAGIDLEQYKDVLLERFSNPNVKDNLSRICLESSAKVATFLIPTLLENLESGGKIECATLVLAAWCYYSDKQVNINGKALDINDVMADELHKAAQQTVKDPLAFLQLENIFAEVKSHSRFISEYKKQIEALYAHGDIKSQMQHIVSQAS